MEIGMSIFTTTICVIAIFGAIAVYDLCASNKWKKTVNKVVDR